MPALEVARQDEPRTLRLGQPVEIIERLFRCSLEVEPRRLVLDDQLAGDEQVDEALPALVPRLDAAFVDGDLFPVDAKDGEELIPERLLVGAFARSGFPLFAERGGAGSDFRPLETHCAIVTAGRAARKGRAAP